MKSLLLVLLLLSIGANAQQILQGRVIDGETKQPLEGARAFISNTTYQTITNADGKFYVQTPSSNYKLGISYIGYESKVIPSEMLVGDGNVFVFELFTQTESLDAVTIMSPEERRNLQRLFTNLFLGTSANAEDARILNIDDVIFNADKENGVVEATCDVPLIIENPNLNYRITFLLSYFTYRQSSRLSSYLGYPSFEELKPLEGKAQKRVDNNREKAYYGSAMHFFRSVYTNTTQEEKFRMLSFKHIPNPKYPGDEVRDQVLKEAREMKDFYYYRQLPPKNLVEWNQRDTYAVDITLIEGDSKFLYIRDYLAIQYSGEKPESNYYNNHHAPPGQSSQKSEIFSHKQGIEIFPDGNISDPDALIFHGYMGWEKVADMLPFDYKVQQE
ncbi:MAG: carboxypeptidase-like regulatory domain-containing protein [Flavobacterium sp.]|nr:carboxypeptidase-like regulatory domain-containing protein [Flavobacterium sp.]